MLVPLTLLDFLRRAETAYAARVGVVDEPSQPAASLGELSYGRVAVLARAQAAAWDRLGLGRGDRVAIVSHNSARMLVALFGTSAFGRVLVPINFRLGAEEVAYIVKHSGARVLLVDPELDAALADVGCEHRFVLGAESDATLFREGVEPEPWVLDEGATATINDPSDHRPPEGSAAHASQLVGQRGDVWSARRGERS